MRTYSLSHLGDGTLLSQLKALVAQDRVTTAELLAHIAEVDERKLYLPAAYSSMLAYCVGELRLSEDAAAKRIQAARVARRFPAIFEAVATGRLHLTAVVLLAPHLTEHTAPELLATAAYKSKAEIERLVAERFPRPDMLTWVLSPRALFPSEGQHAPAHVGDRGEAAAQHAPAHVEQARALPSPADHPQVKPLSGQSFGVQFTLSRSGRDKLRYAQELLSHVVQTGDLGQVFERALDALIPQLERQKFAAARKPRPPRVRSSAGPRHIPAQVRRAVWERDHGQCTFFCEAAPRIKSCFVSSCS